MSARPAGITIIGKARFILRASLTRPSSSTMLVASALLRSTIPFTRVEARKPPALAERMNRLRRASQTTCFRPFQCVTLCLWQQATDTTEGRLSCLSIISSGVLADAARCWSEPSHTGLKRCSARKPKSFPSRLSILESSPTTCTCLSMRLLLWRLISWSTGSRATPRECFAKSSLTFGRCRPCGPPHTLRVRRAECRRRRFRSTSKLRARGLRGEAAEGLHVQDASHEDSGGRSVPHGWGTSVRLQLGIESAQGLLRRTRQGHFCQRAFLGVDRAQESA